jgi:AcrR family transcriptional regulator
MNTQERLIDAAVRLFSEQGFNGTSTREIARLADVNESSLFRYFPRKQDLFSVAVQSRLDRVRMGKELLSSLDSQAHPSAVVPLIVSFLVQIAAFQPELVRLFCVGLLELRPDAERVYGRQLAPVFKSMVEYMEVSMHQGRLRRMDAQIAVTALITVIFGYQGLSRVLMDSVTPFTNAAEAATAFTKFWLDALIPPPPLDPQPAVSLDTLGPLRREQTGGQ